MVKSFSQVVVSEPRVPFDMTAPIACGNAKSVTHRHVKSKRVSCIKALGDNVHFKSIVVEELRK